MKKLIGLVLAFAVSSGCGIKTMGMKDPSVEIAKVQAAAQIEIERVRADAQVKVVQALAGKADPTPSPTPDVR